MCGHPVSADRVREVRTCRLPCIMPVKPGDTDGIFKLFYTLKNAGCALECRLKGLAPTSIIAGPLPYARH